MIYRIEFERFYDVLVQHRQDVTEDRFQLSIRVHVKELNRRIEEGKLMICSYDLGTAFIDFMAAIDDTDEFSDEQKELCKAFGMAAYYKILIGQQNAAAA